MHYQNQPILPHIAHFYQNSYNTEFNWAENVDTHTTFVQTNSAPLTWILD